MKKFLLVEDEPLTQIAQGKIIRDLGYEVDVVASADEALQKLLQNDNHYDLIFVDIGLPDADGMLLSEEVRTMFNFGAPIIAVTALMPPERWEKCQAAGIDGYILKPATSEKISAIIKEMQTE